MKKMMDHHQKINSMKAKERMIIKRGDMLTGTQQMVRTKTVKARKARRTGHINDIDLYPFNKFYNIKLSFTSII